MRPGKALSRLYYHLSNLLRVAFVNRDPDSQTQRFDLSFDQLIKPVGSVSETGASKALVKIPRKCCCKIAGTDSIDVKIEMKSVQTADIP